MSEKTVRCLHLLVKHTGSRNPVSRRTGEKITRSKAQAHEILNDFIKKLDGLKGQKLCDTFAKAASEYSDCGSYRSGGDLGHFTFGQMQKPFSEASFALKIGYMTGIVDTDSGSHIIMRIG